MPRPPSFHPPHCPNPTCDFHVDSTGWRFKRAGTYERAQKPFVIQRYRCVTCKRSFSSQTFSVTYWLRRPDLLEAVFHAEVSCSGHRQIARQLGVSHTTIQRLVERLGRHCLLVHEMFRRRAKEKLASEPLVMDGLGAFSGGQYWPVEVTALIGAKSYYSHDFTVSEMRRSGKMTDEQKKRRAQYEASLGRPDPKALFDDVLDLLRSNLPEREPVELRTDEHKTYRRALRGLQGLQIEHLTISSKDPRTPKNPLFAVNSLHMFLRHSGSNHKRETIAFSKRIQAVIYRHAVFQVWRNLVKAGAERDAKKRTPAQRLGVTDRRWSVPELLAVRRFPTRRRLPKRIANYYWGRVRSRFLKGESVFEPEFIG